MIKRVFPNWYNPNVIYKLSHPLLKANEVERTINKFADYGFIGPKEYLEIHEALIRENQKKLHLIALYSRQI